MMTSSKAQRSAAQSPTQRWRWFLARASATAVAAPPATAARLRMPRHAWQPPPWFAV